MPGKTIFLTHADIPIAMERYRKIKNQFETAPVEDADVIVVLGGDGYMLHSLHQYSHLNKPFYGVNCGTYGFLLNEYSKVNLMNKIRKAKEEIIYPLFMSAVLSNGDKKEALAYNEVSILRHSRQSAHIKIMINDVERISNLICDGVLVSTPAGSTAYNFSARGPIIPLGSNVLALTPVSPFRPRRWNGALLPHTARIRFENLDPEKRPVYVAADFKEWPNVISVDIIEERSKKVRLLFDVNHTLDDRIFSEQFAYGD